MQQDKSAAPETVSPEVLDQAIAWFVRLASGRDSAAQQRELALWRSASPEHELAWQRLQAVGGRLQGEAVSADLAGATLGAAARRRLSRRLALKTLAGAGVLGSGGWLLRDPLLERGYLADYRTATGEQYTYKLADNTLLQLNTATAVNVDFSGSRRRIELLRGEIALVTGKALDSPLSVHTRDAVIRPIGTRFSVRRYRDDPGSRVGVAEGVVEVAATGAPNRVTSLVAGRQLAVIAGAVGEPEALGPNATAWIEGILSVERMRLDTFLRELSRYRRGVLRCDPAVAGLRLTGAYPVRDTDHSLAMLVATLPVKVRSFTRFWIELIPA